MARKRWLRYVLVALALVLVIGVLGAIKASQVGVLIAYGEAMQEAGPQAEAVGSATARATTWEVTYPAVGSVTGAQSVAIAAEVPGTVEKIRFDSGDVVKAGELLVELDARTETAQLRAAEARLRLARVTAERSRQLLAARAIPRAEHDAAMTELATAESDVAALRAQVDRKRIRAPFAGRTGIRAVDLGQYLAPGAQVTTLESLGAMFVDFSLPQAQLGAVRVGDRVRIDAAGDATLDGKLVAIDPTVDPVTRNIRLRASVPEHAGELRSGMFVTVEVVGATRDVVVIVPLTAVVRAPYGDSVFVIEPKPAGSPGAAQTPDGRPIRIARQQFVRLGPARGDFIAIAEGVAAGQEVVSAGAFKLRNGSPIVVDNRVKPTPELSPSPENR